MASKEWVLNNLRQRGGYRVGGYPVIIMKVFCFHCAGGSASLFKDKKFSTEYFDLIPIELPGHGLHRREKLMNDFSSASDFLEKEVNNGIKKGEKWAVLGHSMGALFAYEIVRKLNDLDPKFLILAGVKPLRETQIVDDILDKSDDFVINALLKLGGLPSNILGRKKLMNWLAPIVKADLCIVDSYRYNENALKLPVYVINGDQDYIVNKRYKNQNEWNNYFEKVNYQTIEGDHFALFNNIDIVNQIAKQNF